MSILSSDGSYGHHDDSDHTQTLRKSLPELDWCARMALLAGGFSDTSRVRLLSALRLGPLCVGDLSLVLEMSQSAVSHQLKLLRSIGIVRSERSGRHIYYSIAWPETVPVLERLQAAAGQTADDPDGPSDPEASDAME